MPIRPENLKRYPPDWPAISAEIRFGRAGGRCECTGQCGLRKGERCVEIHGEPAKYFRGRVVLTTMHLNHDPADNDRDLDLWRPWKCACGWRGDLATASGPRPAGARTCPVCGLSPARNNLLAGCQACHNRYDRGHRRVSRAEAAGQARLDFEVAP